MYWFTAFISALLFGASTPISKRLLGSLDPFALAGLFYVGASLALFIPTIWLQKNRPLQTPSRSDLLNLIGSLFWGAMAGPVLLLLGLRMTEATTASLLLNFETPATAVLAWFFFKENMGARAIVANIGLALAGGILVFQGAFTPDLGAFFILAACVAWGLDNNHTASIHSIDAVRCTCLKGITFGLLNLLISGLLGNFSPVTHTLVPALLVGAFSYGISIVFYITSARKLGAARSQMVFSTAPFVGVALSQVWLGEPLLAFQIVAAFIILASLALLFTEKHSHAHTHAPLEHSHGHSHDDTHHTHDHSEVVALHISHAHRHCHEPVSHFHRHWPDIHHRHSHDDADDETEASDEP